MDCTYHYLLMANQALMQKSVLSNLTGTQLTLGQPKVLDYLKYNNGASQKDIAKACFIEPASLTSILNGMEQKGLIERRMLNGNRRSYYIYLTDIGKQRQEQVHQTFSMLDDKAFNNISTEEKEAFLITFKKIYNNLNCSEPNKFDENM